MLKNKSTRALELPKKDLIIESVTTPMRTPTDRLRNFKQDGQARHYLCDETRKALYHVCLMTLVLAHLNV
jgi:hypothetical protein